jgi:hypothetical protein
MVSFYGRPPQQPYLFLPSGGSVKTAPSVSKGKLGQKEIDTRRGGAAPGRRDRGARQRDRSPASADEVP